MNMKELRKRSGKRAEEIAAQLGVAMSTVRNWEQLKNVPRMTPVSMKRVMEVYNCTLDELIEAELAISEAK
jgi:putative transcriptional regulator